jgi:hypothetical protein
MEMIRAIFNTIDHTKRALQAFYENPPEIDDPLDYITKPENEKFQKIDQAVPTGRKWNDPEKLRRITGESLGAGVFRPVGSTLSEGLSELLAGRIANWVQYSQDPVKKTLWNKLSSKQLQQYGTEKFPLDPLLPHSKMNLQDAINFLSIRVPTGKPITAQEAKFLRDLHAYEAAGNRPSAKTILLADRIRNKTSYDFYTRSAFEDDILPALSILESTIKKKQLTPGRIQQKPLASLVSIHQTDVLEEQKTFQSTLKKIQERTSQLQHDGPIVKINDIRDRSADTFVLNNCVGSYSNPTGKQFIPVYHPGTGLQLASQREITQGNHIGYTDEIRSGKVDIYSYRPNGIPVLTIEIDRTSGQAVQVLGQNNRKASPEEWAAIQPYLDKIQQRTVFESNPIEQITIPEGP